jgi:hypothetical protein
MWSFSVANKAVAHALSFGGAEDYTTNIEFCGFKSIFKRIFFIFYSYFYKILCFTVQFTTIIYFHIPLSNQLPYILYIFNNYHVILYLIIHTYVFLNLYVSTRLIKKYELKTICILLKKTKNIKSTVSLVK